MNDNMQWADKGPARDSRAGLSVEKACTKGEARNF